MLYRVEVDLAMRRPPGVHRTVYWLLEAPRRHEATIEAVHWSMWSNPGAVMPVGTRTELVQEGYDWDEDEDDDEDTDQRGVVIRAGQRLGADG